MPVCGREGEGGVVAKGRAVMAGTRCRSARRGVPHRLGTPAHEVCLQRVAAERQATAWHEQGPYTGERSQTIMLESGVRRKAPAPFGRGERLQSPTYPYLVSKAARFGDRNQAHRSGPLTTSNWVPGDCWITTISTVGFCSLLKNFRSSSLLIKSVITPVAMVVATPPRKIKTVPASIG